MQIIKDDDRIFVAKEKDYVIKKFKNLSFRGNKYLYEKLESLSNIRNISELITPFYYEIENGRVKEIYTKYIDEPNLYYDVTKNLISFKTISKCLYNLEKAMKKLHENDIVLADFTTKGNLKYNPINNDIYILDYEDMQVGNSLAFSYSYFLKDFLPINNSKYFDGKKFTKNADIYLLANFWVRLCTTKNLCNIFGNPNEVLRDINLSDNDIVKKILLCYDLKEDNRYFEGDFLNIYLTYRLKYSDDGFSRKFAKKR